MRQLIAIGCCLIGLWGLCPAVAQAQLNLGLPQDMEGVGVDEHVGDPLPLDAEFLNQKGEPVKLGHYFRSGRPVILSLNYSNCPMLCQLQLHGLVQGMIGLEWTLGREYDLVSISIDPTETPDLARKKHQHYSKRYGRTGGDTGVHFLVGTADAIQKVAQSTGVRYKYIKEKKEYSHLAVCMVCTPEAKISRYLYGVEFKPETLRMALVEGSQGKLGTTVDRVLLYCYHYDPKTGQYSLAAMNLVRIAGAITLTAILCLTGPQWLRAIRGSAARPAAAVAGDANQQGGEPTPRHMEAAAEEATNSEESEPEPGELVGSR